MIVYITRHGQRAFSPPEVEEDPEFPRQDRPLSALGREQARLLGEYLVAIGFSGAIYASPYRRTAQTGDIISAALGSAFYPSAPIREMVTDAENMARFSGLTLEALCEELEHLAPDATLAYPWWTMEDEEDEDVQARVGPFIDHLVGCNRDDVLLVGHGASAGAATRHLLTYCNDVPDAIPLTWHCALTAFRCSEGTNGRILSCDLLMLQDTTHLGARPKSIL